VRRRWLRQRRACGVRDGLFLSAASSSRTSFGLRSGGDCVATHLQTMVCSPPRGGVPRYWRHGFAFVGRVNGVTFLFDWSGDASLSAVVCKKRFHYPVCCLEDEARSKRGAVAERRHGAKYCVAVGCRYSWALASPRGRGEIKEGNVAERRRDSSRQWPVAPTVVPNREASDRVGWEQATRSPRSQPTGSVQATETGTFG